MLVKPKGRFPSLAQRRLRARKIIDIWREANPEPRCELYHETPYQLLVSVILSAQTTDKMVNRCMEPLYRQGFDPKIVLTLGEQGLLQHIRSIGLAPTKAKNVVATTKVLIDQHDGQVPSQREALEALPGVGRKTANVILGEVFRQPTLAVDTHVFRVGYRLQFHKEAAPLAAEKELLKVIPEEFLPDAHHWLILHGRYTCKAPRPLCDECLIASYCPSRI